MKIGFKIKKIRQILDLGQSEFAELIGISQSALSKIELDKVEMGIGTASKIAEELDISLDWLALDKGEPPDLPSLLEKTKALEKKLEGLRASQT